MNAHVFQPLPRWDGSQAFRLGVTSYVYPDAILPNVRAVAPVADDVELVLFESEDATNLPSPAEIDELRQLAATHELTYTVHFPIDAQLGSPFLAERQKMLARVLQLVELTAPLQPYAYLLHAEGVDPAARPERVSEWQRDVLALLDPIAKRVASPQLVCLENLAYPFEWCQPFLDAFEFSVCLDAGHFWQTGQDWRAAVTRWLPRTRVIHLYGTGDGTRHLSLAASPPDLVQAFLAALGGYSGVLTLETFGYDDTRTSLERLATCLKTNNAKRA